MSSWPHGYCLRRATRIHLNVGISGGSLALVHNIYPMFKIRPGKRFLLPHIIEFHSKSLLKFNKRVISLSEGENAQRSSLKKSDNCVGFC